MIRSFDVETFKTAVEPYPQIFPTPFDFEGWLKHPLNVMYDADGSVGLGVYEYPGVYTAHWFFKVRGREALNLAREMLDALFTDHKAVVVRGLTKVNLKPARWAAKQLGFKSYGILEFSDGEYELMCLTKDDFYRKEN